jgi:hypothetical protein
MEVSQLEKADYYMNLQNPVLSGLPILKLRTITLFMSFSVGDIINNSHTKTSSGLRATKSLMKIDKIFHWCSNLLQNTHHNIAENFSHHKEKVISLKHIFYQVNLMHRN